MLSRILSLTTEWNKLIVLLEIDFKVAVFRVNRWATPVYPVTSSRGTLEEKTLFYGRFLT